jgi:hypothetical protein
MSKEVQSYWVSETGEWGSNDVETVDFEGHHDDIHESFDMVSDWELPSWAAYLAKHPHAYKGEQTYCETCETLVEQFHDKAVN